MMEIREKQSGRPEIKAVLFDKDGTLIDFEATWGPVNQRIGLFAAGGDAAAAARILDRCGVDPSSGRTRPESPLAVAAADEIADALIAAGAIPPRGELLEQLHGLFTDAAHSSVPLADTPALFMQLKAAGLRLGVASSDTAAAVEAALHGLGIASLVDFHCGYDSGFGPKPQPGMLLAFANACNVDPRDVAMVGDSSHDLIMARSAGAGLAIGVLSGTGTRATLDSLADAVLGSISDLPDLLAASKG
jgi:phosphoglycolate phosphatase